jgi:hypothetical protein
MFDDLRESAAEPQSFEEAIGFGPGATIKRVAPTKPRARGLLGLSPIQRLVLAFMVMLAVCVLGTMCLLITGRISAF